MTTLVSVILPCYNAGDHLHLALSSIRKQTHTRLQIICVNDGSTDHTASILEHHQQQDPRIEIVTHEKNKGLVAALNTGLQHIRGEFFARMDQDDYSPPQRIGLQLAFMQENSFIDIISSAYIGFIKDNKPLEFVPSIATDPEALSILSAFSTPLCHPAVFARASLVQSGRYRYDPAAEYCEDFELFSRLASEGIKMSNLPEALHWLRRNSSSLSVVHFSRQVHMHTSLAARNMGTYMDKLPAQDNIWRVVCNRFDVTVSKSELQAGMTLLENYISARLSTVASEETTRQVRHYLRRYRTDIVLQSIKKKLQSNEPGRILFCISALELLPKGGYKIALTKLGRKLKFKFS